MRYSFVVHFAHLQVFAKDALHSVMLETKHAADLLLGQESLAFDQAGDSIDIS
jgi:hypothetical protein